MKSLHENYSILLWRYVHSIYLQISNNPVLTLHTRIVKVSLMSNMSIEKSTIGFRYCT